MTTGKTPWWHASAGYVLAGLLVTLVHAIGAGFIDIAVIKQLYADNPCGKTGAK